MRIQHNIMAMNAYRNYNTNTSALSKNLEKLSSGYKVNRAGDDAAGLAISEKMRAQITGLEAAQKNVKDGLSLVNTAEGAMQEIQDMLNRMVYLAEESANGTFDNAVDRKNLQAEVDQLKDEINRIADSANFNGIKLLDGSLSGTGSSGGVSGFDTDLDYVDVIGSKGKYVTATVAGLPANKGEGVSYTLALDNGVSYTFEFTADVDEDGNYFLRAQDGTIYKPEDATALPATTDLAKALKDQIKKVIGSDYTVKVGTSNVIEIEAKTIGTGVAAVTNIEYTAIDKYGQRNGQPTALAITMTKPVDTVPAIATSSFKEYDGTNLAEAMFTINGQKFVFAKEGTDFKDLAGDITVITASAATDAIFGEQLARATGLTFKLASSKWEISAGTGTGGSGGLTLQIGDTSDSYNQLRVSVGDMHVAALGVSGVNIGNQAGAQSAVNIVKNAINKVSEVRGRMGAYSNRLDHTAKNLSVMRENIQDAESTIRDTDVAEEMMSYTKNNILVQSAQAMLAQANQVPQGVLQLLQ